MGDERDKRGHRFRPNDYLVGFFGSLVPGILFLVLLVPAFLFPVLVALDANVIPVADMGDYLGLRDLSTQVAFHVEWSIIGLVFAYVLGFLFFRQDTKPVDRLSCLLYGDPDGPVRFKGSLLAAQGRFRKLSNPMRLLMAMAQVPYYQSGPLGKELRELVQYPYPHLKKYLQERGFHKLAGLISEQGLHRTKHAINRMKIVVNSVEPSMYHPIAQAEAHVRLASSSWYVCNGIRALSVCGVLTVGWTWWSAENGVAPETLKVAVLASISTLLFVAWFRRQITKAFHYQRIREVIIVLQTFLTVRALRPEVGDLVASPENANAEASQTTNE